MSGVLLGPLKIGLEVCRESEGPALVDRGG